MFTLEIPNTFERAQYLFKERHVTPYGVRNINTAHFRVAKMKFTTGFRGEMTGQLYTA